MQNTCTEGDDADNCGSQINGCPENSPPHLQEAEGILHHTTSTGQPVVEYSFMVNLGQVCEGFHQPRLEGKGVVSNDVERDLDVVVGKFVASRESNSSLLDGHVKVASPPSSSITSSTLSAYVNIQESVLGISKGQEYHAVELLVVEVLGSGVVWLPDGNVLPIQRASTIVIVPSCAELAGNLIPLLGYCGAPHALRLVCVYQGLADERYKQGDGTRRSAETEAKAGVRVAGCQEPQCHS